MSTSKPLQRGALFDLLATSLQANSMDENGMILCRAALKRLCLARPQRSRQQFYTPHTMEFCWVQAHHRTSAVWSALPSARVCNCPRPWLHPRRSLVKPSRTLKNGRSSALTAVSARWLLLARLQGRRARCLQSQQACASRNSASKLSTRSDNSEAKHQSNECPMPRPTALDAPPGLRPYAAQR